jgi:TPR repeat protein
VNGALAEEWLIKSSTRGNVAAQMNLADCYRFGDRVNKSMKKALKWYTEASNNGKLPRKILF